MAVPIVTASPNSALDTDLPITSTVTGSNIFERPNYTDRELFTQIAPDALASAYFGGLVPEDGIIGNKVVGDGATKYIVETSFSYPTNFFYYSFFGTMTTKATNGGMYSLNNGSLGTRAIEFHVLADGRAGCNVWGDNGKAKGSKSISSIPMDTPMHFAVMLDMTVSASTEIAFFINGLQIPSVEDFNSGAFSNIWQLATQVDLLRSAQGYVLGDMCNFYESTNSAISGDELKYANLPTVDLT